MASTALRDETPTENFPAYDRTTRAPSDVRHGEIRHGERSSISAVAESYFSSRATSRVSLEVMTAIFTSLVETGHISASATPLFLTTCVAFKASQRAEASELIESVKKLLAHCLPAEALVSINDSGFSDCVQALLLKRFGSNELRPAAIAVCRALSIVAQESRNKVSCGVGEAARFSTQTLGSALAEWSCLIAERVVVLDQSLRSLRSGKTLSDELRALGNEEAVLSKLGLSAQGGHSPRQGGVRLQDLAHAVGSLSFTVAAFAEEVSGLLGESGYSNETTRYVVQLLHKIKRSHEAVRSGYPILQCLDGQVSNDLSHRQRPNYEGMRQPEAMITRCHTQLMWMSRVLQILSSNFNEMALDISTTKQKPAALIQAVLNESRYEHPDFRSIEAFIRHSWSEAQRSRKALLSIMRRDPHFGDFFKTLPEVVRGLLDGKPSSSVTSQLQRTDEMLSRVNEICRTALDQQGAAQKWDAEWKVSYLQLAA